MQKCRGIEREARKDKRATHKWLLALCAHERLCVVDPTHMAMRSETEDVLSPCRLSELDLRRSFIYFHYMFI